MYVALCKLRKWRNTQLHNALTVHWLNELPLLSIKERIDDGSLLKSRAHHDIFKMKFYCTLWNEFANVHGAQANGVIGRVSQPNAGGLLWRL